MVVVLGKVSIDEIVLVSEITVEVTIVLASVFKIVTGVSVGKTVRVREGLVEIVGLKVIETELENV
jgi:hypothetical protein